MTPAQLRARALAALAQREHSRAELKRKLLAAWQRAAERAESPHRRAVAPPDDLAEALPAHAFDDAHDGAPPQGALPADAEAQVEQLLDAFTEAGWLSEPRYIESRLRSRAPRLGARRLAAELKQQGLSPEGEAWDEVQATEEARARALLTRRFGDDPPPDLAEKARRTRFLVSRGFAPGLVAKLLKGNPR